MARGFFSSDFFFFMAKIRSLESLPKKCKKDIADERRHYGNCKINAGKNISDCPHNAPILPHPRAFKFPHQEVGIKQVGDT